MQILDCRFSMRETGGQNLGSGIDKTFDFFSISRVQCNDERIREFRNQPDRGFSTSADQAQENSWVSASQRGDAQSFNRLVLKWEKPVYNLALRMLHDREEAAEATQEIFLLAFKSIRRFRRDSKFSTWLYRIAINHCVTRVRQTPAGIHLSLDDEGAQPGPPEQLTVLNRRPANCCGPNSAGEC